MGWLDGEWLCIGFCWPLHRHQTNLGSQLSPSTAKLNIIASFQTMGKCRDRVCPWLIDPQLRKSLPGIFALNMALTDLDSRAPVAIVEEAWLYS